MAFSRFIIFSSVFLLSISAPAEAHDQQAQKPSVSTTGTGVVAVAPDMAVITIGVVRENKTAKQALSENNKAMASVLAAMKAKNIEEKDLQTTGFNIQPRYVYPKRKSDGTQPSPYIDGYIVSNNLTIRIRDLASVGQILDETVQLGVNSGGNIQFQNADTGPILEQARAKAVIDAIAKAKTLTSTANVKLGQILFISEHSAAPHPVAYGRASDLAVQSRAEAVPVAQGENEYRVNVNISWELDQ